VHTKARTAFRAGPLYFFLGDKILDSDTPDTLLICDEADSVLYPVALVHLKQVGTGIFSAGKTELVAAVSKLFTVIDDASKACVRLVEVTFSATRTRLLLSNVSAAQAAIKAARRDDHRVTCLNLNDLVRHCFPLMLMWTH
jgi:hypothetical protein